MTSVIQEWKRPYRVDGNRLVLQFHPGQWRAWDSEARYIVVLAGTQGGKTTFGPHWLYREIQRCGPGDYFVVTPTYKLLNLKALPEFLTIFKDLLRLGNHKRADSVFEFDALGEIRTWGKEQEQPTRVLFGHAQDPDSLESATAKAAWLDEAGQDKFKLGSFEAIMRRLSLAQGRVLITTTPYNLGWVKQKFWDRQGDQDIDVIRFDSTENPAFPQEEMERARRDLPLWKFDMFYRAIFTRPAGMIFDCYDEKIHKIRPFAIPPHWPRSMGQDYGGVNTVAVFLAFDPETRRYYLYREYLAGGRTAKQHKEAMLLGEHGRFENIYGGSGSEQQWRDEFSQAGLYVARPPIDDVEVGIQRVYGALQRHELFIFDTCERTLDQLASYARELNEMGEPTEKIADKETFHFLDALRYIGAALWGGSRKPSSTPYK